MSEAPVVKAPAAAECTVSRPPSVRQVVSPPVGEAKLNFVVPLEISPTSGTELPGLDLPGCLPPDHPMVIRRDAAKPQETETLLNAMIGECHFLMREVAFRCIVQSPGAEDRLAFMRSAMSFAETGATVAKAVAKLRHAPISEDAMIAKALASAERRRQEKRAESAKQ